MFKKDSDEYQDIKMIIGFEDDGRIWPFELQFLLKSISESKKILHLF